MKTETAGLHAILDELAELIAQKIGERVSPAPQKRLMTLKEAGVYIGRTAASVQQLVARGEIPSVVHGRRRHVLVTDLDEWIDRNRAA